LEHGYVVVAPVAVELVGYHGACFVVGFQEGYFEVAVFDVGLVFEDVADPQQAEILKTNACFLKKGAAAMLAVKARSVSSVEEPRKVFEKVKRELEDVFDLVQEIDISPFEKDHEMLVLRKK
jgi:fibrillarin-like pre-rRNA processing protein